MSIVVGEPGRVQVQYTGYFAEPVFGVLGNPAALYANLLRHLGRFGATVGDLRIDVSVLAEANVTCSLPLGMGLVRVWVNRLEVYVPTATTQGQVATLINAAWAVMTDTDPSLRPVTHSVIVAATARLRNETYATYSKRLLTVPLQAARWRSHLEFDQIADDGSAVGSVRLEAVVGSPDDLFVRSTIELGSIKSSAGEELLQVFLARLKEQLHILDLELLLLGSGS